MKLKNICFIANGYPSEEFVINAFVETLVNEMTDQGVNCYVIAPQSITNAAVHKRKKLPYERVRYTNLGNEVKVYTPQYITASAKKIGAINTSEIGLKSFKKATEKAFIKLSEVVSFDAVYGHFIFPAGITANYLGKRYGIPAFFAYGENTTYTIDYLGDDKTRKLLEGIVGVVSVSSENKRVLLEKTMTEETKIGVFPNSVDTDVFYPQDKAICIEKLGLPKDKFVVAFVGRFVDVKGPDRLSAALEKLNDEDITAIFIGEGNLKPTYSKTAFCGMVAHDKLPNYLSAADVFVLPTKAEGCCNAIIEAMACGLPIISSNLPFNADILNDRCAKLIDPMDIDAIAEAISELKNDKNLREKMAEAALEESAKLNIKNRASQIIEFIENKI